MDQRIIELYDEYTHKPLPRRVFMERLVGMVGSVAAAEAVVEAIAPNYARAAIVPAEDARIATGPFEDTTAGIKGYIAAPKGVNPDTAPNFIVTIHENRGLNPHIQDIARRLAVEGFVAMAPDLLLPLGGTPADQDAATALFPKLDLEKTADSIEKLIKDRKAKNPNVKIGVIGFCWGGAMVNMVATRSPELVAAVSYYGLAPKIEDTPKLKARFMEHLGALDDRVNATIPPFEEALKKAGAKFEIFKYEGANHAFNNDTGGERYNKAAADLSWSRSMALFHQTLM